MDDGKIYIYIQNEPMESGQSSGGGEKENGLLKTGVSHMFFNFCENQAKSFVNYTMNNIGNFTGNYQGQRDMQVAQSAVNQLVGIGTAFAVGGVVGGALAVASSGINIALQEYSQNFQVKKQNREIEILREKSGLNTLTNGSR